MGQRKSKSQQEETCQEVEPKKISVLFAVTNWDQLGDTGKKTGWYLPEVAHPYHVFKKAGYQMTVVSPKGGKTPVDPSSVEAYKEDQICKEFLEDTEAMNLMDNSVSVDTIDPSKFHIIFYAGGHGPMWDMPDNELFNNAAAAIYEAGGIASAVCHGPVGIVNTKLSNEEYLVKGKKVTCFTNDEETSMGLMEVVPFALETKLVEHGAEFDGAPNWHAKVVVSERVLTGQNPQSATPLAEAIVGKVTELNLIENMKV